MELENILKICYEKNRNLLLIRSLKEIIAESVDTSIEDMEYEDIKNGFQFVYDGETDGEVEITFGDKDKDTGYIEIKTQYPWEAIELYNLIQQQVSAEEI